MTTTDNTLTLAQIRARLEAAQGKEYWRSLEELANGENFTAMMQREFPRLAPYWPDGVSRRNFLKLMAASLALAGLAGCSPPPDKIVPYIKTPADIVPGKPLFFASALTLGGYATGVLVESTMGRPIKVEGNPNHPASLGATDHYMQAATLGLYDPDRAQAVTFQGRIRTYDAFSREFRAAIEAQRAKQGAGIRILTQTVTSPSLAAQLRSITTQFPGAKWHQYEPVEHDNAQAGARLAFGQVVETRYQLDRADVILALDADFLYLGPGHIRYAREFSRRRTGKAGPGGMNRLYVVESGTSVTGSNADNRLPMRSCDIEGFARAVAVGLGVQVGGGAPTLTGAAAQWVTAVVKDLQDHRGASAVIPGQGQPPIVHALAHAMNQTLGAVGATVVYTDPVEANPVDQLASLRDLISDMQAGRVELLAIISGNPAYDAPADLRFGEALSKAGLKMHLTLYEDETSARCDWTIPMAHELEGWGDARAFDGTASIIQPLILPLYGGKTAQEILALFTETPDKSAYALVRDYWQTQYPGGTFDAIWSKALNDGMLPNTALPAKTVSLQSLANAPALPAIPADATEIVFRPDPGVYDGRFANNAWLQEMPKPLTTVTWDNVAQMSPAMAERLGVGEGSIVRVTYHAGWVEAPALVLPGHADNSVTLALGYGRTRAGRVGTGQGYDAYAIRSSVAPWFDIGAEVSNTGGQYALALTQLQHLLVGRPMIRDATLEEFLQHPDFAHEGGHHGGEGQLSMYPPWPFPGNSWGMTVDTSLCIGCNACMVACQAENNIPVVGKDQVKVGRHMNWLRVDHYYKGSPDNPESFFQPRPCMQCENAPCEGVCPVAATTHSYDGLNDMAYNRCVGTRYCANNCPYKVRRFNFLQFTDYNAPPTLRMLMNPEVTVRSRGVMEKCTYCVQRIRAAEIEAKKGDRPIRDGEILTACQAVCPSQAITFGNINDPNSAVSQQKADSRNYSLLEELNTRPRTTYLAAIRNPNPELAATEQHP